MTLDRIRSRAAARRNDSYLGRHLGKSLCFVQGDQSIANQAGASFRSDLNTELQALVTLSSGATAPSTTYAHQLWVDTTANVIKKRNAANSGWIVKDTIDESFILSRASNTILGLSDRGKTILATAGFTQTLTAAATLGDGWCAYFINTHATAACTIDPNSTETINGATTQIVPPGCGGLIVCNGSAFRMSIAPQIDSTGNLIFAADNTYDIGASGATRPRDLFLGRNLAAGGTLTVSGTGTSTIAGLLDLSGASAGQIKFPATQNASADANTLDDYEEGTWTSGIEFGGGTTGITYTAQNGTYTKIGRQVSLDYRVILTSKGSSTGNAKLTGLPFTPLSDNSVQYIGELSTWSNMNTNAIRVSLFPNTTTKCELYTITAATAFANSAQWTNTDFSNATSLAGQARYPT